MLVAAPQHDGELLATDPVDRLEGTQVLVDPVGDVAQHRVALREAVAVVDRLETVEVAENHRDRLAGRRGLVRELGFWRRSF